MPFFREALDMVGDDTGLAAGDALEQVAVRHEGNALLPRAVGRREMLGHVKVRPEEFANPCEQFFLHHVGFFHGAAGELVLVEQHLAAHDLVDPGLVDLQFAQLVGQLVFVTAGDEIGW